MVYLYMARSKLATELYNCMLKRPLFQNDFWCSVPVQWEAHLSVWDPQSVGQ